MDSQSRMEASGRVGHSGSGPFTGPVCLPGPSAAKQKLPWCPLTGVLLPVAPVQATSLTREAPPHVSAIPQAGASLMRTKETEHLVVAAPRDPESDLFGETRFPNRAARAGRGRDSERGCGP